MSKRAPDPGTLSQDEHHLLELYSSALAGVASTGVGSEDVTHTSMQHALAARELLYKQIAKERKSA